MRGSEKRRDEYAAGGFSERIALPITSVPVFLHVVMFFVNTPSILWRRTP